MIGRAEEFDARSVREEERPELENLVVLGKGLLLRGTYSAETGDEKRGKQATADRRDESPTLFWSDERDGSRIAMQHFLISRTEGEALEVVRGAEQEQGVEQWRRLAALDGPLAAGRSLDDSRQILSPPDAAKLDDLSHAIRAWGNCEQRHLERTGDQLSKVMRLAVLLTMCPTDLERELTAQQHLFPDYAQMKAHIVRVTNNRTRGLALMMMGNFE